MTPDSRTTGQVPIVKDRAAMSAERTVENEIKARRLVDETGATIDLPEEKVPINARNGEPTVGGTGPNNWWRAGILLIGVIIVVYILLAWLVSGTLPL